METTAMTKSVFRRPFGRPRRAGVTALGALAAAILATTTWAAGYRVSDCADCETAASPTLFTALGGGGIIGGGAIGGGPAPDVGDFPGGPELGDFASGLASAPASTMPGLAGGYIDPAVIATRVRFRYDNFDNALGPTRAEYLYPTIAQLGGPGPGMGAGGGGIGGLNASVDYEEINAYVEWAFGPRLSIFGDVPVRWVGPIDLGAGPATQRGAGDIKLGVRLGIMACCDESLTLQFRFSTPTGSASQALGVGHSSIDIALLYQALVNDRTTVFAEIQDWQTTSHNGTIQNANQAQFNGQLLNGNVLRMGVGLGYDVWQDCCADRRLTAVFEVVAWEVLDGLQTSIDGNNLDVRDANGDSIVNGKYGVRFASGCNSLYVGYGHNWTNDLWYSDLFRLEYARQF